MVTQSIIAVPMLGLYGISILIALLVGKDKEKRRSKDEDNTAG
jgi:sec-independent protein translocase protein TatC